MKLQNRLRDGRAKKIDEAIAKAQAQVEGINANLAEIDEILKESNNSSEENAEKRGIK